MGLCWLAFLWCMWEPRKHGRGTSVRRGTRHQRLMRDAAFDAVACALVRVCVFFFFFFLDSCRLSSIRANAARFVPNRLQFTPNRDDSARIRPYRPNRPKIAEIGWNRPCIWPEKLKLAFFFFGESMHSNVFFKNILIVKIYIKYK